MINQYTQNVIRYRWLVVLATIVLFIITAVGLKNFAINNDYRHFFSPDNPQLQAFETLQDTYNKSDNVMFIITPKDGNVFSAKTLESIEWLTDAAWQTPFSSRVDSVTNFQHTKAFEDDLDVASLVKNPSGLSQAQLKEITTIAIQEPALLNRLINKEASVTAVNVTVQLPGIELSEATDVARFARDLADQVTAQNSNLDVRLTGIVMMNNAFGEASEADMATLVPGMFLVVLIVLGLMLRSITLTISTLFVIIISIVSAVGIACWSGIQFDPLTMSAPTIIMTMAVADSVHLLTNYLWIARHGTPKHEAMQESIRINMMPIFLTSVTTALGFLSMNFSEVPPLANLGNIVAVGVLIAFVLSVSFLPALAVMFPVKVKNNIEETMSPSMVFISNLVINRRKPLLWIGLAVSVFFISFVPKNEINDDFVKYFDPSVEFRQDTIYAAEHLVGPYTVEFSVNSNKKGNIADPDYLKQLQSFVDHLYSYDSTIHVFTLTDTMKQLNKNLHGDDKAWHKLPEERDLAAQYLLLYEMSLPYGLDLNNQIDIDKSATRITLSTINLSSQEVLDLETSINTWIADNLDGISVASGSPNLMFAHIGQRNAKSLVVGTTVALIFISLILIIALRSFKIGLISLIPNIIPAGIAFGIWAIIDGQIGMSVSIVAGMTIGIVVDDTVHFLSKYLRARREKGFDSIEATRYAFNQVGVALVTTTIVLVAGFGILTLSTFKMNADMGLVTAITITTALIIDFLVLPPLLMLLDKKSLSRTTPEQDNTTPNLNITNSLTH